MIKKLLSRLTVLGLSMALLICAPCLSEVEISSAKEKIFSVLLTQEDPNIVKEVTTNRNRLDACGYHVVSIDSSDLGTIKSRLEKENAAGALILVDSHGLALSNGEFLFVKRGIPSARSAEEEKDRQKDNIIFSGAAFMDALSQASPKSRVWVDTCFAGFCPLPKNCKVGKVCTFEKASTQNIDLTSLLIDLLCSKKTDCKVWRAFDSNGDGLISGQEFESKLKKLSGATTSQSVLSTIIPSTDPKKSEFNTACSQIGGVTQTTALGFPLEVRIPQADGKGIVKMPLNRASKEPPPASSTRPILAPKSAVPTGSFSEDHFASSTAEARKIAAAEGFEAMDVVQLSEENFVKLTCVKELPSFRKTGHSPQMPDVSRFDLEALNCANRGAMPSAGEAGSKPHEKTLRP